MSNDSLKVAVKFSMKSWFNRSQETRVPELNLIAKETVNYSTVLE